MKEQILDYINQYNKEFQIKIEYAVLEPFLNAKGERIYNLHVVYSPRKELLLRSYLSGSFSDGSGEKTLKGSYAHQQLTSYPLISGLTNSTVTPVFSDIEDFTISNIARFYNFKFNSPTDPFLSMFLETDNIIYISPEFKVAFLDKKDNFKPHPIYMLHQLQETFAQLITRSQEYSTYTDKNRLTKVLEDLHKTMKLYFIALSYHTNKDLVSSFEEKHVLILNTLAQSHRPWEFVQECINTIKEIKFKTEQEVMQTVGGSYSALVTADSQKAALKQECYLFLNNSLIGELDAERNSNP
jgi:hypothetical protein